MALEERGGNFYYYRSVRDGKKVRRVFVGAGEIARIAHERDVMSRAQDERRRQEERRAQERLEAL